MKIQATTGQLETTSTDALIVNLFQGVTSPGGATGAVDKALGGAISDLIAQGDLTGKSGEVIVLYPRGSVPAKRVLVAGLGKQADFDAEAARRAAGKAAVRARELGATSIATVVHGAGVGGLDVAEAAEATAEGTRLALYRYDAPKQRELSAQIQEVTLVEADADKLPQVRAGAERAAAVSSGVELARDLVNGPANRVTPEHLGQVARELGEQYGFGVTVGDRAWAAERNMGAFLAVAQGTEREAAFIVIDHHPEGVSGDAPVVLVGKGITFDTGGISIKPSAGMEAMTSDMGGAAAVLGAMKAIGELGLQRRVVAIAACAENMPDGAAFRPGDVLTASNGKTIEVLSTDAEGRLVLADALVHAGTFNPSAVIDLATLTGACVVALGSGTAAGLFGSDQQLVDQIRVAGDATFERAWHMPLYSDYRKTIDSDVADLKNTGGRAGGVGTAAVFLQEFTDYPWAHLDIAGMALNATAKPYGPKGASGYGVRLLLRWLADN